jgi:hypothetical protein
MEKLNLKRQKYREIFMDIKPKYVIEIGVGNGNTLTNCYEWWSELGMTDVSYTGFDLFEDYNSYENFEEENPVTPPTLDELESNNKYATALTTVLIKGDTREQLPKHNEKLAQADLIFIDGGHSYNTVKNDWSYVSDIFNGDHKPVVIFDDVYHAWFDDVRRLVKEIESEREDLLFHHYKWDMGWGINGITVVRKVPKVAFISLIQNGNQCQKAFGLVHSIRKYGGKFKDAPILLGYFYEYGELDEETIRKFLRLNCKITAAINPIGTDYPIGNKLGSVSECPNRLHDVDYYIWIDTDMYMQSDISEFFDSNFDLALYPPATSVNPWCKEENQEKFREVFKLVDAKYPEDLKLKSSVTQKDICPWFNASLVMWKSELPIGVVWKDTAVKLRDVGVNDHFLDQIALLIVAYGYGQFNIKIVDRLTNFNLMSEGVLSPDAKIIHYQQMYNAQLDEMTSDEIFNWVDGMVDQAQSIDQRENHIMDILRDIETYIVLRKAGLIFDSSEDVNLDNDIDLLIHYNDMERVSRSMREHGFTSYIDRGTYLYNSKPHTHFVNKELGIHFDVVDGLYYKSLSGDNLWVTADQELLNSAWENKKQIKINGKKIWVLAAPDFIAHIAAHCIFDKRGMSEYYVNAIMTAYDDYVKEDQVQRVSYLREHLWYGFREYASRLVFILRNGELSKNFNIFENYIQFANY